MIQESIRKTGLYRVKHHQSFEKDIIGSAYLYRCIYSMCSYMICSIRAYKYTLISAK